MHGHPSKLICRLFEGSVSVKIFLVKVLSHVVVLVSSTNDNKVGVFVLTYLARYSFAAYAKMAHFLGVKNILAQADLGHWGNAPKNIYFK